MRVRSLEVRLVLSAVVVGLASNVAAGEFTPAHFVANYCVACHGASEPAAGFDLESLTPQFEKSAAAWEKVIGRLRARQMPPMEGDRPSEAEYLAVLAKIEGALDQAAERQPQPGTTSTMRRLTRTEYQNAVRDLLALEIDAKSLLPEDEASHGFDNITVEDLSPTRMNRFLLAARKISQLAVGSAASQPDAKNYRLPGDQTQENHVEGLPLGTRGGTLLRHHFPREGEYEIRVRLARDRNEHVDGLKGTNQLDMMVDRRLVGSFSVKPPDGKTPADGQWDSPSHDTVDQHLVVKAKVTAGPHDVGVTFVDQSDSLLESPRQPLNVRYNFYRHPRLTPAVYEVTVTGPFGSEAVGDSPTRRALFTCRPTGQDDAETCARTILKRLLRLAYRRPVVEADLRTPMDLFREAHQQNSFDAGIEAALSYILVSPHFLFRIESVPEDLSSGAVYELDDWALASRLSFFLWSSLPDDELLRCAERGDLSQPAVLEQQVRRMLADDRSQSLTSNFAGQWLHLRNLASISPDQRLYPDFDANLRESLRRETELFFADIVRKDRSVLQLLQSDYTYLNERLAKHYGMRNIHGSRFRRVSLPADSQRGGLLRQGSILTVTSYATRTSPVLRGKWVLENLLGSPPPPPPENVPPLEENSVDVTLSLRERLAQHRASSACAMCHNTIDPVGFSLENFDALGQWRSLDGEQPVDATGGLPDGSVRRGVAKLEEGLLERPDQFVGALAKKLLTYSLGRGVESFDGPAIRKIVRRAEQNQYRFSALVLGVVESVPFQMREVP